MLHAADTIVTTGGDIDAVVRKIPGNGSLWEAERVSIRLKTCAVPQGVPGSELLTGKGRIPPKAEAPTAVAFVQGAEVESAMVAVTSAAQLVHDY